MTPDNINFALLKQNMIAFYLDWFNNWLTPESMAEYYGISVGQCNNFINQGREWYKDTTQ